ncbi:uncharacterized protein EI90DRAFT_3031765 [Cantharellus anzutake]|uniref:uncharacterized protein n=1 Tax=Cantharellus anzutake TaxID=1750568 RepID=UPI0019060B6F|nr:uncharacterized protein EI90DRAFT_3031765 [Cantharellus anzutake]KAF8341988.1 hypothetical protein EI90DRAFT_3031765 [Cantharellus anzutake]
MFLNFATISLIVTLLSFTASVTAHPTAKAEPLRPVENPAFAGAILSDSDYEYVTSTFAIPDLHSTDPHSVQHLKALVGLHCLSTVSVFVSFEIPPNGTVKAMCVDYFLVIVTVSGADSWLEPISPEIYFNAGDVARISIEMKGTGYVATIENLTKKTKAETSGTPSSSGQPAACLNNVRAAIWGIDESGDNPFVEFSSIEFYDTHARAAGGSTPVGPSGATIYNITAANGAILTSTTITPSTVTISYRSGYSDLSAELGY